MSTDPEQVIASCALDEAGVRRQRARYARLAASVSRLERDGRTLSIEFGEDLDRRTLDHALAVERACCPFFRFELDPAGRRLQVGVRDADQVPALDAIAHALEMGSSPHSPEGAVLGP